MVRAPTWTLTVESEGLDPVLDLSAVCVGELEDQQDGLGTAAASNRTPYLPHVWLHGNLTVNCCLCSPVCVVVVCVRVQWGAECSSMMFELPHFAVELLVILPCVQVRLGNHCCSCVLWGVGWNGLL